MHAAAHFSDGFPTVPARARGAARQLVGTTIYSQAGAPVIAVQDGKVVQIGHSAALGRFLVLRDAFGNTYTYAHLGDVASLYPVLAPHVRLLGQRAGSPTAPKAANRRRRGPATAGAQPRSPVSEGAVVSGLALGAAAGLEPARARRAGKATAPPILPRRAEPARDRLPLRPGRRVPAPAAARACR